MEVYVVQYWKMKLEGYVGVRLLRKRLSCQDSEYNIFEIQIEGLIFVVVENKTLWEIVQ